MMKDQLSNDLAIGASKQSAILYFFVALTLRLRGGFGSAVALTMVRGKAE